MLFRAFNLYFDIITTLGAMTDQRQTILPYVESWRDNVYSECKQSVMTHQLLNFINDTFIDNVAALFTIDCGVLNIINGEMINNRPRSYSASLLAVTDSEVNIISTLFTNDANYDENIPSPAIVETFFENSVVNLDQIVITNFNNVYQRIVYPIVGKPRETTGALFYMVKPKRVTMHNVHFYNNTNVSFFQSAETDLSDFARTGFYFEMRDCIFGDSSSNIDEHEFEIGNDNIMYNFIEIFSHGFMEVSMNNVSFSDIDVSHNYSLIYIHQDYTADIELKNIFIENCVTGYAPVIHLNSDLKISNSVFRNNAFDYGVINSFDENTRYNLEINNCTFENNHAATIGGGIYSFQNSLQILNSRFVNNFAKYMAGDIGAFGDKTIVRDSEFYNSKTNDSAGSIWIGKGYASGITLTTIITNCTFKNAESLHYGGAILHETSNFNMIKITNNTFIDCVSEYGSVMNVINTNEVEIGKAFIISDNIVINTDDDNHSNGYNSANGYDFISLPYKLVANVTSLNTMGSVIDICPNCPIALELSGIDLFGQKWIPYSICNKFFLSTNDPCINIDVFHSVQLPDTSFDDITFEFEIHDQSAQFLQAFGQETLRLYPLPYEQYIYLTISSAVASIKPAVLTMFVNKCSSHYFGQVIADHAHSGDNNSSDNEHHIYFTCTDCDYGTYRLEPTINESCLQCPPNMICNGGDDIYVFEDYYAAAQGYTLHSYQCLSGACCQDPLCPINLGNVGHTCPENRDSSSPLCSACVNGTSAVHGNQECFPCDSEYAPLGTWIAVFVCVLVYGVMTYCWGKSPPQDKKAKFWNIVFFRICAPFYQMVSFIQLQNVTDFSIDDKTNANVLVTDEEENTFITNINTIIGSYFNAEIPGNYDFYVCLVDQSKNVHRLALQYVIPVLCVVLVGFHLLFRYTAQTMCPNIHKHCKCLQKCDDCNVQSVFTCECCCACVGKKTANKKVKNDKKEANTRAKHSDIALEDLEPPATDGDDMYWKDYYYSTAVVNCTSLVYAQIIKTSFQLISCRTFAQDSTKSIMYYDGTVECFQGWHAVPIILIVLGFLIPLIVTYILYAYHRIGVSQIQNGPKEWYGILALPYKPQFCYFEGYRMLRLFVLSLLLSIDIDEYQRLFCIRCLLLIFITIHLALYPFNSNKFKITIVAEHKWFNVNCEKVSLNMNHLETLSLYLSFLLTMLADFHRSTQASYHGRIELIFNIIVCIPFVLSVLIIGVYYFAMKRMSKMTKDSDGESRAQNDSAEQRSFRATSNSEFEYDEETEMVNQIQM